MPVNAFPAAGDYYKAVQAPARCFTVPKLQAAHFVWDSLGPTLARGSSAVVFQAAVEGRPQALRCYIREDASSRDRYSALGAYLAGQDLSPYVSGTTWLDRAIMVNRTPWPVLTMEWIDGRTLNEYVDFLVTGSNAAALTTLAGRWRELVALLQRGEFAHGDLQHGNVMVDQDGQLRLVDFDGVWIPQLAGQPPPTEYGHPNYQHPLQHNWNRWLDTFSALVIYLSLVALSKDPGLWLALYNSKNLLFAKTDFFPPFTTEAWKQLAALRDPQVDELARKLQECCDPLWVSDRSLETTLEQPAAALALPPVPADQRWWEKRPVPGPGTATPPSPSRPRPQAPPSPAQPAAQSAASPAQRTAPPLPAPPPLSAPLGMAGTGPMPQLSQKMVPPSDTIWWTLPPAGQAQGPAGQARGPAGQARGPAGQARGPAGQARGPAGPGYHGSVPPAPMPMGYAPRPPVPPPPGPPMPGPAVPARRTQTGPVAGAITLALGILLLIIGATSHIPVVVIGGLVAGAWGMWRLVTGTGKGGKPPGQT